MKRKVLALFVMILAACNVMAGDKIVVTPEKKAQQIEGWGVSLCWWAYMCGQWDEQKVDSIVDWLVSPDGLNYNIFRYNIGGGDDPQYRHCKPHHMVWGKGARAEMPGFKLYEDSPYDWSADSAQIKIMRKIKERRPDAIFEAFSNSAPWYMTESGCCGGNRDKRADNLKPEYYEAFSQYLIDVCKHIKDTYGIEFRTLEPFNEPLTDYWYQSGSQEGCHFDVKSQIEVVKRLYPMLKASGLNTVIGASDETCTEHSLSAFVGYQKAGIMPMVGQWNTHTYYGSKEEKIRLSELTTLQGIRLWQSESGDGGRGIHGNLKMLQRLFDDMRYLKPAAWCDWQYFGEHDTQWCLISGDFKSQRYYKIKNFYVRQHVSRFIHPGYTILNVTNEQTLAALSPDGKTMVIVCLNNDNKPLDFTFETPCKQTTAEAYTTTRSANLEKNEQKVEHGIITTTLAPQSVKTFVMKM